jgi:hypothetical protein
MTREDAQQLLKVQNQAQPDSNGESLLRWGIERSVLLAHLWKERQGGIRNVEAQFLVFKRRAEEFNNNAEGSQLDPRLRNNAILEEVENR